MVAKIVVSGPFAGPNFVRGLALQTKDYKVKSDTKAVVQFKGGLDPDVTYKMVLHGEGFGMVDGRFTGTVKGFTAIDKLIPDTTWEVTGFNTPLDLVNTNASSTELDFFDLLVAPSPWKYVGNKFVDVFFGSPFDDVLKGRGGDDTFLGFSGDDTILGGRGKDTLEGNQGADKIFGGSGDDLIRGGVGKDKLFGESGDDKIKGGGDVDKILGGDGRDKIFGGDAGDLLRGGKDKDFIWGEVGQDTIFGGGGDDELYGGVNGDTIFGGSGDDWLFGEKGTDILKGNGGDDGIFGGGNLDKLSGGKGEDTMAGGAGSDTLRGGKDDDILSGNKAHIVKPDFAFDGFIFAGNFGDDVITDFEIGFDYIVLAGAIKRSDVSTSVQGDAIRVDVDHKGGQSILVEGPEVVDKFNSDIDIIIA